MTLIPLSSAPAGLRVKLVRVDGAHAVSRRLRALGLAPGTELSVVQRRGDGLVLGRNANRIAVGLSVAETLLVRALT